MLENIKNWKTTLIGLVALLIPILVAVNVLDQEKATGILTQTPGLIDAIIAAIGAIAGFVAIFKQKDA